ncbi:MAG: hypothetical protein WA941_01985 [Nitrososphaeraceae archaeon]
MMELRCRLNNAREFAKALNAEILLLHIVKDVPIPPSLVLGNERIWIAQTRRTVSRKLAEGWMKMAEDKIIKGLANENMISPVQCSECLPNLTDYQYVKYRSK